mgnify:CR=1 FL=1
MSHEIKYSVIPINANKKAFKAGQDEMAYHDHWQESSEGLPSDIRWIDYVCANQDDAERYIETHDKGWYDQLAVKFKQADYSKSKKLSTLNDNRRSVVRKMNDLNNNKHFANVKSSLISCKCCGSKIAVKYMAKTNYCPVCRNDMRPDTIKNRIKSYNDKIAKIDKDITQLKHQLDQKGNLYWLVKTEWHS